jgi:hypothetical protein
MAGGVDFRALVLDPVQGFVLSRVDGRTSLGEICLIAPFPEAQTVDILRGLHAAGVIEIPGVPRNAPGDKSGRAAAPPAPPVAAPSKPQVAAPSKPQVAAPPAPPVAAPSKPQVVAASGRVAAAAAAKPADPTAVPPVVLPTVVPARPRAADPTVPEFRNEDSSKPARIKDPNAFFIDEAGVRIEMARESATRIDEMLALVVARDPWKLLGVARGVDPRDVRRAYFRLSKEFHPDRYFGRDLGHYKKRLQEVFLALTEAFERLTAENKR